jgi:exonuclease III
VHKPAEDKSDDAKDSFYEELQNVFNQFLKCHMNIFLGDFNAKLGREDILKPTVWNESSDEIGTSNGFRVVNFATLKKSNYQEYYVPT